MPLERNISVHHSQESVFSSIMEYLDKRRVKIGCSTPSSFILAEIGSLNSMSLSDAIGDVKINITKRDEGCDVNLSFNFIKDYAADMAMVAIAELCNFALFF